MSTTKAMPRFASILVGLLATLSPTNSSALSQSPAGAVEPHRLESFVDGLAAQAMDSDHIAGLSVAIVQGGRPLLIKGYGFSRLNPRTPVDARRTLFRIGSLSKTLTWIAVMQQVEQGRLRLDAPVDSYLPAELRTADSRFSPIRMIDLMSHSAGYENNDIGHLFASGPTRIVPVTTYLANRRPDRVRAPGSVPTYSNYGAQLAAVVAERVANVPFDTLVERDITLPLGMRSTTFREPHPSRNDLPAPMPPALAARISDGFVWGGGRFQSQPFEHVLVPAAGSASSTASDMANYMLAQLAGGTLNGVRIYSPSTATAFRSAVFKRPPGATGWAHGFQVWRIAGHDGFGHGGDTQLFHTMMVLVPDLDLGVFVSTNTASGAGFAKALPKHVIEQFYPRPPGAEMTAGPRPRSDIYAGHYVSTRRGYSGLQKMVGLMIGAASVAISQDGQLVTHASTTNRYLPDAAPGVFRSTGEEGPIEFAFDRDGHAVRWYSASGTTAYERVSWFHTPNALLLFALVALLVAAGVVFRWPGRPASLGANRLEVLSIRVVRPVAALWLICALVFAMWMPAAMAGGTDSLGAKLVIASSVALTAGIGSVLAALLLLLLIRRRLAGAAGAAGWSRWQLGRHAAVVVVFVAFAALLASWGALSPWSS